MRRKPNIVFLFSDHQLFYRHGWDGGPKPRRPFFDRLASQGIDFARAYTSCPLCMPARRTVLTGAFPHNHGLLKNDETMIPSRHELYLNLLVEQGYRCYYYGKWHAGPGTALDHHCKGFCYTSYGNPYITQEYRDYLRRSELPRAVHLVERSFWPDKIPMGKEYSCERSWCNDHASGLTLTPKETHESFFLAHLACEKLRKLSGAEEPFALRVDFWGPHQPYFPTKEFADLYDSKEIPEYKSFGEELSGKPKAYLNERNDPLNDGGTIIQPNPLPWSEWQKIIARCYGHITMVDTAGGLILEALNDLGLEENTFVLWTTDHGDALASHGGHFDKGSYMPEEVIRIPMAIRWPERIEPGQVSSHLVSLLDVAPTILDVAGTDFKGEIDGTSLLPIFEERNPPWREDLMCETDGHPKTEPGRAVITDRFKYVAWKGQMHELYDLENDPYEMDNLIDVPERYDILNDLQQRLRSWQERTHDSEKIIDRG